MYKGLKLLCATSVIVLLWSCKAQMTTEEKAQEMTVLNTLLAQQDYRIAIDEAQPFNTNATLQVFYALNMQTFGDTPGRINVSADGHVIKIQNDSITGSLPFFGERQLGSASYGGRDIGIQFESKLKDFSKSINEDKGKLIMKFSADQKDGNTENHDVIIEFFPNHDVFVKVNSTHRTIMGYRGRLEAKEAVE